MTPMGNKGSKFASFLVDEKQNSFENPKPPRGVSENPDVLWGGNVRRSRGELQGSTGGLHGLLRGHTGLQRGYTGLQRGSTRSPEGDIQGSRGTLHGLQRVYRTPQGVYIGSGRGIKGGVQRWHTGVQRGHTWGPEGVHRGSRGGLQGEVQRGSTGVRSRSTRLQGSPTGKDTRRHVQNIFRVV